MNISNETHVLVDNNEEWTFVLHKLPYRTTNCDYIVYWNDGESYALYSVLWKEFYYIPTGNRRTNVSFKEKPKDKPWTIEDALQYIDVTLYKPGSTPGGELTIVSVSHKGVYGKYGTFISYEDMLKHKMWVGKPMAIPAYKPA